MGVLRNRKPAPVTLATKEIRNIVGPLTDVARQLRRAVQSRRYSLIVGEDTSGRIPTLILAGAINRHYAARGEAKVPVIFLQGSKDSADIGQQRAELERRRLILDRIDTSKRALIISDIVSKKGATTAQLMKVLAERGIECDVAAITFDNSRSLRRKPVQWQHSARFYHSHYGRIFDDTIWRRDDLSGMVRRPKFAKHRVIRRADVIRTVRRVRADVKVLAPAMARVLE